MQLSTSGVSIELGDTDTSGVINDVCINGSRAACATGVKTSLASLAKTTGVVGTPSLEISDGIPSLLGRGVRVVITLVSIDPPSVSLAMSMERICNSAQTLNVSPSLLGYYYPID
jgi:hypothetical protein